MLTPIEIDERFQRHVYELDEFTKEVEWVHRDLVALNYPGPNPVTGRSYGFHHSCHAYVMLCFAWFDALSKYWAGGERMRHADPAMQIKGGSAQTARMVSFLQTYHSQSSIHRVTVEMWRHTLMHESKPREIRDDAGNHYEWRLYWEMDASMHYTIAALSAGEPYEIQVIQMGLLPLSRDVRRVLDAYFADLRRSNQAHLRQNYADREREMQRDIFAL